METNKYKIFEVTLKNGTKVIAKAPTARLTEKYAIILVYHWINMSNNISDNSDNSVKQDDVISIKGIGLVSFS